METLTLTPCSIKFSHHVVSSYKILSYTILMDFTSIQFFIIIYSQNFCELSLLVIWRSWQFTNMYKIKMKQSRCLCPYSALATVNCHVMMVHWQLQPWCSIKTIIMIFATKQMVTTNSWINEKNWFVNHRFKIFIATFYFFKL